MRIFESFEKTEDLSDKDIQNGKKPKSKWYNRIYARLLAVILLCSVTPCILSGIWINRYVKDIAINRYMISYLDSIYQNVEAGINHYIDQISAYSFYIFLDREIYYICDNPKLSAENKQEIIRNYLDKYWSNCEAIENLDIIINPELCIRKKVEQIESVSKDFIAKLSHTNILISDNPVRAESGKKYIVFGRSVFDINKNKKMFDLLLYVPEEKIYGVLEELNSGENLFFLTAGDKVISHPDKANLGYYTFFDGDVTENNRINRQFVGDYFYDFKPLKIKIATESVWKIKSRLSYGWLYRTTDHLRKETMVFLCLFIVISVILAIVVPLSLMKSIESFKKKMCRFVENGASKVENDGIVFEEIAELEQSFNKMAIEINDLIEKNNQEKEKQRKSELKALQAQINPHFIYNALDAIVWYAKIEKQNYIAEMIYELATFFRIGLHKGDNVITLREEIEHVESYISIEQMRFPGLFEVSYKVQEDLLDVQILKILLQPIVENCIKHGFEYMENGGKISITGYRNADDLIIEVEDNGMGTDINPLLDEIENKGYGIRNVNERIQLEYGINYGIDFKSTLGKGTIVKIRLKIS